VPGDRKAHAQKGTGRGYPLFRLTKASNVCILGGEGPALRLRVVRMASRKVSDLLFMCRFRHASNQQKVTRAAVLKQRDVKNEDRTDYVYENKEMHDNMSGQNAQILQD